MVLRTNSYVLYICITQVFEVSNLLPWLPTAEALFSKYKYINWLIS